MFDLPPSALVYFLIVPGFVLVLAGWLFYGFSQAPTDKTAFYPYGLGLMLAVVAFVLVNLMAGFLGEVLAQVFGPSAQPPPDASETWERPFNYTLELVLGAFYFVVNVLSCGLSLWWSSAPINLQESKVSNGRSI